MATFAEILVKRDNETETKDEIIKTLIETEIKSENIETTQHKKINRKGGKRNGFTGSNH